MSDLDFLEELVNRSADGAYVVNESQRIIAWNAAAERLVGIPAKDALGKSCYQVVRGRTAGDCLVCRAGCMPLVAAQRGQLVPSFDAKVRTHGGDGRWVNLTIIGMSVPTGNAAMPVVVIHLFRDIETRRQAELFTREVAAWARQFDQQGDSLVPPHGESAPAQLLTQRECQVLELLVQGATTESIAATLVIGIPTVRNHIQRILHKLGVHSRLEAAAYAHAHGMPGEPMHS